MVKGSLLIGLVLLGGVGSTAIADDADAILGLWATARNEAGQAHILISRKNGIYQGEIVWLEQPYGDRKGGRRPKVDRKNPDPSLRDRPLLGLRVAKGFRYTGGRVWTNGMIYDPDTGRTYRSRMHLTKLGALKVRGYIGFPLLGNTTKLARPAKAKQTALTLTSQR